MASSRVTSLLVSAVLMLLTSDPVSSQSPHSDIIKQLVVKIKAEQAQETIPFVAFEHAYHKKGVYASIIKQNFHGDLQLAEARRNLGCYDNNMFATAWVTSALLEAFMYSGAPKPEENQFLISLDSMTNHHDHNRKYNNSLMTFWEQLYNQNVSYYQSTPYNIREVLDIGAKLPIADIDELLHDLGLGEFGDDIKRIIDEREGYLRAFHIPPDFDDTFVNLGLGSLLYTAKSEFPQSWQKWSDQNTNLTSVFDALKKYAYRPFSGDRNTNSLDPRTYVWLRKFIDQAATEGKNLTIVPTWIQNLDELAYEYEKGVIMPFEINNVDTTVAANTIFGITSAIIHGLVSADVLDDPDIESVYHNTSLLLAYEINNNMTNRPDLALLYYPSEIEYDWFVARTYAIMDASRRQGAFPKKVMEDVYQILKSAVQGEMTRYILFKANYDELGRVYYDDFLGNGDLDSQNRTLKRAEDRIFTTAMAANALMYTWTTVNQNTKKSSWRPETPDVVKRTVTKIVEWLTFNVLGDNFDPWNAFFSGSFKGYTTWQDYPHNVYEYVNGTKINGTSHHHDGVTVRCVRGHLDEKEYEQELVKMKSPTVFHGYNADKGFFPYWSSTGYTYSISLLVFSRYDSIVSNEN